MAFKTYEQLGRESRRKMRKLQARFESSCPQCKRAIAVGDTIGQPYARTREGGNEFSSCWYCDDCAEFFQRGVDCGYLLADTFLTIADKEAFESRPDVAAWMAESEARHDAAWVLSRAGELS